MGRTGGGRGGSASYGSLEAAEAGLRQLGRPILKGAMTQGALAISAAAFPQFAGLLYGGYAAYQGLQKVQEILKEYDLMTGSWQEKALKVGITEGAKALVGNEVSKEIDSPMNDLIEKTVHITVNALDQAGVFREVAKRVGVPAQADDLEYFFATATQQSLAGAYGEVKTQLAKYVAEGVTG